MKRLLDIAASSLGVVVLSPLAIVVWIAVRCTSRGPAFHRSRRIGQYGEVFEMLKFRTMLHDTPQVATHLLEDANSFLTPIGSFLRRTSLDEIPQLLNVLKGEMSLVGPRPALFNQLDLAAMRAEVGLDSLRPGITGLAQISGRDQLELPAKVELDHEYLVNQSTLFDLKIILATASRLAGDGDVTH